MFKIKRSLRLLLVLTLVQPCLVTAQVYGNGFLKVLKNAPADVILDYGTKAVKVVYVRRKWKGDLCVLSVKNNTSKPVRVPEVIVFGFQRQLADTTKIYGEGFQKLQQTGGT